MNLMKKNPQHEDLQNNLNKPQRGGIIKRFMNNLRALFIVLNFFLFHHQQIVHRTFAAMIASTLSIALLAALNDRPTHEEIMGWIDVETILLLFAMMILVGILTETGVFDHLAVYAYRVNTFFCNELSELY